MISSLEASRGIQKNQFTMFNVKRSSSFASKSTKKRATQSSTKLVKLIKKVAAAEVHRNIEDKQQSLDFALTAFNNAVDVASDIHRLFPLVSTGTNSGDRTGDSIKLKSLIIRGHLTLTSPTISPRIIVRMIICQPKSLGTYGLITASTGWLSTVLRNGNTTQGMDGTIKSMYLPTNTEGIQVWKDKVFYLDSYATTTSSWKYGLELFKFELPVANKTVRYDSTSAEPMAFSPCMLMSYAYAEGIAPGATTSIQYSFNSTMKYEDA